MAKFRDHPLTICFCSSFKLPPYSLRPPLHALLSPQSAFDIVLRSLGVDFLITRIEGKNPVGFLVDTSEMNKYRQSKNRRDNRSMYLQWKSQTKLTTKRTRTCGDDRSSLHCNQDQTKVMVTSNTQPTSIGECLQTNAAAACKQGSP